MFFRQAAATTAGIAPPAQPGKLSSLWRNIDYRSIKNNNRQMYLSKTIIDKCIVDVSHSLNIILYK